MNPGYYESPSRKEKPDGIRMFRIALLMGGEKAIPRDIAGSQRPVFQGKRRRIPHEVADGPFFRHRLPVQDQGQPGNGEFAHKPLRHVSRENHADGHEKDSGSLDDMAYLHILVHPLEDPPQSSSGLKFFMAMSFKAMGLNRLSFSGYIGPSLCP